MDACPGSPQTHAHSQPPCELPSPLWIPAPLRGRTPAPPYPALTRTPVPSPRLFPTLRPPTPRLTPQRGRWQPPSPPCHPEAHFHVIPMPREESRPYPFTPHPPNLPPLPVIPIPIHMSFRSPARNPGLAHSHPTSPTSLPSMSFRCPARNLGLAHSHPTPPTSLPSLSPRGPFPCHSEAPRGI